MHHELTLLNNYLILGAVLFGIGATGFLSRRNMIVMFLSAEIMLQGVSLSLVAWSRFHNDFGGQVLVVFIIAVAACEAAVALALVVTLFERRGNLDVAAWQALRESNQPPLAERRCRRSRRRRASRGPTCRPPACGRKFPAKKPTIGRECEELGFPCLTSRRS